MKRRLSKFIVGMIFFTLKSANSVRKTLLVYVGRNGAASTSCFPWEGADSADSRGD